jgi:outer membrane protein OmpA-like peptidoglycan-associated protein
MSPNPTCTCTSAFIGNRAPAAALHQSCRRRAVIAALACALLGACAAPPTRPVPAPLMSRIEFAHLSLKAMNFEQEQDGWHLTLPAPLVFEFDRDAVSARARESLLRVGRELAELGIERALVRGHTDNVGNKDYNRTLSLRRATAVARVLIDGGFAADRIETKGLGDSQPIGNNTTADGRLQNRRVVIIVQVM